jgi:hypothetical protein
MQTIRKSIILLLLILLLFIPALHKITADMPPDWFIRKFENSWIAVLPSGLTMAFYCIVILEIVGPLILFIGLLRMLLKKEADAIVGAGLLVYYILFLILTFGSFMVQDYDNGFKDFMYFIGVLILERTLISTHQKA